MKRVVAIVLALVLVCSMMLGGCTAKPDSGGNTQGTSKEDGYHFVLILKDLTRPFMITMGEQAKEAAKILGVSIDVVAPQTASSTEEQIKLIEDAIASSADGIMITPGDSTAIVPGIEKANAAGIPIVTPNTKAYGGDVTMWAGVENYDVGFRLGEALAEEMGHKGKVVLLEGVAGASTSTDRIAGYKAAIAQYPDMEIIASQTANYKRDEGMSVMENLLQRFPEIDGIGSADKEMLLGANEAVKAANRTGIKGVGFDVDEDILVAIENGEVIATGDQRTDSQVFWTMAGLIAELKGYVVPSEIAIPITIVNKDNVGEYLKKYK